MEKVREMKLGHLFKAILFLLYILQLSDSWREPILRALVSGRGNQETPNQRKTREFLSTFITAQGGSIEENK